MDEKKIQTICAQIYRRCPEVTGVRPKVKAQERPAGNPPTYLLTFSRLVRTADNKPMQRWVRVVADEHGEILKVSTSR